jgi:hypothetical protein
LESGGFSGGTGWLGSWSTTGGSATQVVATDAPHGGANHLRVQRSTGSATRSLNLSVSSGVRLRLWAKASGFAASHTAVAQVSSNGVSYTTVQTWTVADSDGVYRFYDLDLSGFTMTASFSVAFVAQMQGTGPKLFIDDIELVR